MRRREDMQRKERVDSNLQNIKMKIPSFQGKNDPKACRERKKEEEEEEGRIDF